MFKSRRSSQFSEDEARSLAMQCYISATDLINPVEIRLTSLFDARELGRHLTAEERSLLDVASAELARIVGKAGPIRAHGLVYSRSADGRLTRSLPMSVPFIRED